MTQENNIEEVLDRCLEEIKNGADPDEIIAHYPDHADELRPLIGLAARLQALPKLQPRPEAVRESLIHMGQALKAADGRKKRRIFGLRLPSPRMALTRAAVVGAVLVVLTMVAVAASSGALPGDLLYPVKLTTEKIRLVLTSSAEGEAELRLTFSEKRLQELLTTFDEKGEIDKNLVSRMLEEATIALDDIADAPPEKQEKMYSRYNHFCAYQKEALESLESQVSESSQKHLHRAIRDCENRHESSMQMMGKWKKHRMMGHMNNREMSE